MSVRASLLLIFSDYRVLGSFADSFLCLGRSQCTLPEGETSPEYFKICYLSLGEKKKLRKFSTVGGRKVNNSDFGNIMDLCSQPVGNVS